MTKQEIIQKVADMLKAQKPDSTFSKGLIENCIDSYTQVVREEIAKSGNLQISQFGTFKVVERKERQGRNPQTGAPITIAASKAVKFNPAKALKESL